MLNELIENEMKYVNDLDAIYTLYLQVGAVANARLIARWCFRAHRIARSIFVVLGVVWTRFLCVTKDRREELRP